MAAVLERDPLLGIPYPKGLIKAAFKAPIVLWRLGLGPLIGHQFMIMTTTGRVSGQPRRTAIEYHVHRGRKYALAGWGKRSQWYKNALADPRMTIQTADGTERVRLRRVVDEADRAEAWELIEKKPSLRAWARVLGVDVNRERFIADKETFFLVTFDPTDEPTPPPLEADLVWVWPAAAGLLLGALAALRLLRRPR